MALKPMIEPEKGPDEADLLKQAEQDRERANQEFRERQAATDAQLAEMRNTMDRNASMWAQAQRQVGPAPPAQTVGPTAEDIQNDPNKALAALTDHIRKEAIAEIEGRYAPTVTGLTKHAFESEMSAVKNERYWDEASSDVNKHFAENPQDYSPGRVREVYNYMVGKNIESYQSSAEARRAEQAEKDRATGDMRAESNRSTSYESPPSRGPSRATSAGPDDPNDPEKYKLSEEEDIVREKYNRLGTNISRKEWIEISAGNVFPKTMESADWQAGYNKEGRKVRGGDY